MNPLLPVIRSWSDLCVWDRLEILPSEFGSRDLRTSYRVTYKGTSETFVLRMVYPTAPWACESRDSWQNLADLCGAQAALNYGLMAREIQFQGSFDTEDRRFLAQALENTSREIALLKILGENPFLKVEHQALQNTLPGRFTQARLVFNEPAEVTSPWPRTKASEAAVLSSGGKDSLLSTGLLDDLGQNVHPLFVNESGRHWLTALNTWRSFERTRPQAARVWTNVDRLFTFLLRRMPFIRPDFQGIRADIYPIRLWTVPVFIFALLPLIRARRCGRMVVGNEYDTSRQEHLLGVPHFDGLFDQSVWFDRMMTRYFARKGWPLRQFSLLRPFSELLIQGLLARRYPDLLAEQVSCHAAHSHNGRVLPCGRCEKCRRILSMLSALGQDVSACGYTPGQRDSALALLPQDHLHQDEETTGHTRHLLAQRGLLPDPERHPPWPWAFHLRFHPRFSPEQEIPEDLRLPLLALLEEETDGVSVWSAGSWNAR